jgi:hypothetical protein
MLEHLAALWLVFVVFTWVFKDDDPAARKARRTAELASASAPEHTAV